MARKNIGLLALFTGFFIASGLVRAGAIVTLEAFGSNGQPVTAAVAPGTAVTVDILLSADAENDPLADVRMIQFDFDATSTNIELVSFTWSVDANGYSFQDPDLPLTNVTSILFSSSASLLALTSEPVKVASVEITINGSGTLDLINPANTDFENFGADIRAGFAPQVRFNHQSGNLQGGSLEFSVTGSGGGGGGSTGGGGGGGTPTPDDQDGDGVVDEQDAFPDDPAETTDTNNDGVGNNADPDDDSDGVVDGEDAFPVDPVETTDTDQDGIGNNADTDDDGDGVPDVEDSAPLDPSQGNDNTDDGGSTAGPSPRACGAGMLGSFTLIFLGLGLMSHRQQRRL